MVFDFLKYFDDNGIEYVTSASNLSQSWIAALDCPWCNSIGKNHLGIPPDSSRSYCWACGGHGLENTIRKLTPNKDVDDILDAYGDGYAFVNRLNKPVTHATKVEWDFPPLTKEARKYLAKRGFDPDYTEEHFGLRWGGITGPWAYRILVPIYQEGVLVSYQGRTISKLESVRYKTLDKEASVIDPKNALMGIDRCTGHTVVVTEGPFDHMKWGDGSVSVLGISTTETQARRLAQFRRVILLYDPEPVAQARAKKFGAKIASLGKASVEVVDTELDDDLGAMSYDEIDKLKEELGA